MTVSYTLYLAFWSSLVLTNTKWAILYGILICIVVVIPGFTVSSAVDINTVAGMGPLTGLIYVQFYSPLS